MKVQEIAAVFVDHGIKSASFEIVSSVLIITFGNMADAWKSYFLVHRTFGIEVSMWNMDPPRICISLKE
jgi:hypothetical protein